MKQSILFGCIILMSSPWRSVVRVGYAWTTTTTPARRRLRAHQQSSSSLTTRLAMSSSNTAANNKAATSKKAPLNPSNNSNNKKMINLHTIPQDELEALLQSWGQPKYRAKQIQNWVRVQGVSNIEDMNNLPKSLKSQLLEHATIGGTLELDCELVSKDGTIKRAYRLQDGQLIESVLMPYRDGRYTACISSQAGCAQGCVFCATGQMGFSRQLTPEEIFEQVARFASELAHQDKQEKKELLMEKDNGDNDNDTEHHGRSTRLSNIVFMGMGEPLANYRNVVEAVQRIQSELGIGHRKITISTVGIVPNIAKLAQDLPQVRLAVSLHCANDEERSALLPANQRYGGLNELMQTLQNYMKTTGRRITLEWALIELQNDTPDTAHELGKLIKKWLRRDMVHVNVIPLNPTGGFGGSPSGKQRVNDFCQILNDRYGVACTPRVRRGIDINAGCGQLKAEVEKRQKQNEKAAASTSTSTSTVKQRVVVVAEEKGDKKGMITTIEIDQQDLVVVLEEEEEGEEDEDDPTSVILMADDEDWEDYQYTSTEEQDEAARLMSLVQGTVITAENGVVGMADRDSKK